MKEPSSIGLVHGTHANARHPKIHPCRMQDTAAHLEGAANLEKLCFHQPWSVSSLKLLTNEGIGVGYVCTADGEDGTELITAYGGMLITVDEGQITNIAVHPDHRREGLGMAIVRTLLRHAQNERLASVTLEVRASNTAAIDLYKKVGFSEVGRRKGFYTKPVEDALIMEIKCK